MFNFIREKARKIKASALALLGFAVVTVSTICANINVSGLGDLATLIYAFVGVGVIIGIALVVYMFVNWMTGGKLSRLFGGFF